MVAIARDFFKPQENLFSPNSKSGGKINLSEQLIFTTQRTGWKYALQSLSELHSSSGIKFDGYVENNFGWRIDEAAERGEIPYREPWIGIAHHPQDMPEFFDYRTSPQHVFDNYYIHESLKHCKGLFTLSKHYGQWLQEYLGDAVPVETLFHPTDLDVEKFTLEKFLSNEHKRVVSVGHWLRRFISFKLLPVHKYSKTCLIAEEYTRELQSRERFATTYTNDFGLEIVGQYSEEDWLENEVFDQVLTKNIVFADYYGCSASNTVLECIARNTPIAVNPHPAVVEYLGEKYPLYFSSIQEAADKIQNLDIIEETTNYLSELDKERLSPASFSEDLKQSKIYQSLEISNDHEQLYTAEIDELCDLNVLYGKPLSCDYVFAVCFRNQTWKLQRCIESICSQSGGLSFGIALVDDASEDKSESDQLQFVTGTLDRLQIPYVLVKNKSRKYLCQNLYNISASLVENPDSVIIQVDGDDYLIDNSVLGKLDAYYAQGAEMTFGSFDAIGSDSVEHNVEAWTRVQDVNLDAPWDVDLCCSWMHLKTYRKSLFDRVPKVYFLENNGKNWLKTGEDISVQPKMAELAHGNVIYIKEPLYVYDLSGSNHEIKDVSKPEYIVENLFRLPQGSFIGECLKAIQIAKQNSALETTQYLSNSC